MISKRTSDHHRSVESEIPTFLWGRKPVGLQESPRLAAESYRRLSKHLRRRRDDSALSAIYLSGVRRIIAANAEFYAVPYGLLHTHCNNGGWAAFLQPRKTHPPRWGGNFSVHAAR
jgi:hypothetical protein